MGWWDDTWTHVSVPVPNDDGAWRSRMNYNLDNLQGTNIIDLLKLYDWPRWDYPENAW